MRTPTLLALAVAVTPQAAPAADPPMPRAARGWAIERVAEAPQIAYPTAVVVGRDGTIYLGQDPMDMPGPPTSPIDSVVAIRSGHITTFASGLWAVMGLEWVDGTLFVVHAPFLSAFRDTDGDGKADRRTDLVTGLGPDLPGFNGINDHIASGIRLGIDGYLYIAVGDKGIPRGVGRDGSTIRMSTGGVIRVRPDGSGLEVVSTGERNPLSVALTATDEIFTLGNDDDSKKWPNSLTHHVVGGHHGYPHEFLTAPFRALPIVAGQFGGAGAQGICFNEDGLPPRHRGNLIFCDWGQQAVHRYEVAPDGGTFRLVRRERLVDKGDLADFRPFSVATGADGASLILADWAFNGWLADGPRTGRVFRLTYTGDDRVTPAPRPSGPDLVARLAGLDHPALSVRLESQRGLSSMKGLALTPLEARLRSGPTPGRIHALWALDAIGGPKARRAIRSALADPDPAVRLQAARASGVRRDPRAKPALARLLLDADPAARREAAIALGRLGEPSAGPSLYAALGDPDAFAAWSIRKAIRALGAWDREAILSAMADPNRREDALKLADESWAIPAIEALSATIAGPGDAGYRARAVVALGGMYRRYPEWSGRWFGTNPLAGSMPVRSEDWAREGMDAVLLGLARAAKDPEAEVRRPAIVGLYGVGSRAAPILRAGLATESDPVNLATLAQALGALNDPAAAPRLAALLADASKPIGVRSAALDALAGLGGRPAVNGRLSLVYDPATPPELVARALPGLGRGRVLPVNDLAGFLNHGSEAVRAAALAAFPAGRPLPDWVRRAMVQKLDDPSPEVRHAAIEAVAAHEVREATPKLATLAIDVADRTEATRALARMPDPRGLPAFVAALKDRDPEIRRAGESALVAIRDDAAGILESEARQGRFVGPSALAVERILARFRPVADWKVIGPFPRTTPALFADASAIDFARTLVGAGGRPVAWEPRKGEPRTGRLVIDDLKAGPDNRGGSGYDASGSADLAAFAHAEVASDRDRPALLMVGSSGPILVSVNDKPVLNQSSVAGRPFAVDSDLARVTLRRGVNRILVRTRQGAGPWSFGVQVSEPSAEGVAVVSAGSEGLRAFALGHGGDAKHGRAIFFEAGGVGCVKCHAVGGVGTSGVGPDLAGLAAKYDKAEVIRSILDPSARIAAGFQPAVIARRDGTVLNGVVRSESEAFVDLVDSEARVVRLARSEIEERRPGQASTMPSGLVDALAPVDFADLVAYLMTLKGDAPPAGQD